MISLTEILAKGAASDKVLHNKLSNVVNNSEYNECHRGLASIVKFFDKLKVNGAVVRAASADTAAITQNQQLPDELHKPGKKKLKNAIHIIFYGKLMGCQSY